MRRLRQLLLVILGVALAATALVVAFISGYAYRYQETNVMPGVKYRLLGVARDPSDRDLLVFLLATTDERHFLTFAWPDSACDTLPREKPATFRYSSAHRTVYINPHGCFLPSVDLPFFGPAFKIPGPTST